MRFIYFRFVIVVGFVDNRLVIIVGFVDDRLVVIATMVRFVVFLAVAVPVVFGCVVVLKVVLTVAVLSVRPFHLINEIQNEGYY